MSATHALLLSCGIVIIGLLYLCSYLLDRIQNLESRLATIRRLYRG